MRTGGNPGAPGTSGARVVRGGARKHSKGERRGVQRTSRLPRIARFSFPACLMALTRRLKLMRIRRRVKKRSQPCCASSSVTPTRSACWICFIDSFTGFKTSNSTRRSFVVSGTPSRFIAARSIFSVTRIGSWKKVDCIILTICVERRFWARVRPSSLPSANRKSIRFPPFFEMRSRNMLRSACAVVRARWGGRTERGGVGRRWVSAAAQAAAQARARRDTRQQRRTRTATKRCAGFRHAPRRDFRGGSFRGADAEHDASSP